MLVDLRDRAGAGDGRALGRDGDRLANALIVAALGDARPHDAVRSEEQVDTPGRAGPAERRVWVVDPLDGTREYGEGRVDFAVHVALVVAGRPVVGAVALPGEDLVFRTGEPPEPEVATRSEPRREGHLRVAVSRTRPPPEASRLAARLGAELVPMGSAGVKIMAVVRGTVDAYVHSGGQYEWDSAAPVAVALAHGMTATRLDGAPLVYDRPDPWLPDLLVCRPDVVDAIHSALGR